MSYTWAFHWICAWPENSRMTSFRYFVISTHSFPMHPFSTPWKHQKTLMLMFSEVRERVYWERMAWRLRHYPTSCFCHSCSVVTANWRRHTPILCHWSLYILSENLMFSGGVETNDMKSVKLKSSYATSINI